MEKGTARRRPVLVEGGHVGSSFLGVAGGHLLSGWERSWRRRRDATPPPQQMQRQVDQLPSPVPPRTARGTPNARRHRSWRGGRTRTASDGGPGGADVLSKAAFAWPRWFCLTTAPAQRSVDCNIVQHRHNMTQLYSYTALSCDANAFQAAEHGRSRRGSTSRSRPSLGS